MTKKLFEIVFFILVFIFPALPEEDRIEIGIDEQLGKKLPLDLEFFDEQGNKKPLRDFITGTTVFAFVYYDCPGICSPLMTSIAEVVNNVDLKPLKDYNIVTLSFDETEDAEFAAEKKINYMNIIEKEFPENGWRFLTGDSASIKTLTDAAGFYFKKDKDQFIHSGALIFISEDGKICRYLFPQYSDKRGYSILPFDFRMAVAETAEGKEIPTVARMLQFCFSYDPKGQTYVLNFTRIFGAGILLMAVVFVLYLTVKPKKEKRQEVYNGK
ncbi:MAG: SCO family protein [Ignavibacteriales bacterium]|nr:MAG: SCO family protein [Ignavibacteriales bacterium]